MRRSKTETRNSMKTISVPRIEGLSKMTLEELNLAMESHAKRQGIDSVNWSEYPYCPIVSLDLAADETHLFLRYFVRGEGVKASFTEDNDAVWQDSCVEAFFAAPDGKGYFNFEMNCIATLLAAKRLSRKENVEHFSAEQMAQTIRFSTLPHEAFDEREGIHEWSVILGIPFILLGYAEGIRPAKIRANFYKCGDNTRIPHYVSWNPIEVTSPDFHRPEYFGELLIE